MRDALQYLVVTLALTAALVYLVRRWGRSWFKRAKVTSVSHQSTKLTVQGKSPKRCRILF